MVADFGEATYIPPDGVKRRGLAKGTMPYWAPELHKKFYDNNISYMPEKTDVYALGVLMSRIASLKDEFVEPVYLKKKYPYIAELIEGMV
jgi:serine/threonine protein kinase